MSILNQYIRTLFYPLLTVFFVVPFINGMATTLQAESNQRANYVLPNVIVDLIEMLNESRAMNGYSKLNCWNSLLISGPEGNGKATYAHTIVEQTGATLIEFPGSYFTSQEHDGCERLRTVYQQIKNTVEQDHKPVVFFIKDAEVITNIMTQWALWSLIDQIRDDPRILVVLTVKRHLGIFDAQLSSRMFPLEVENPTYEQRVELVSFYWNKHNQGVFPDQKSVQIIARKSINLSIKEIKGIIETSFGLAQKKGFLVPDKNMFLQEIYALKCKKNLKKLKAFLVAQSGNAAACALAAIATSYVLRRALRQGHVATHEVAVVVKTDL